jgi:phospholipase C
VSGSHRADLDVHASSEEESGAVRLEISNRGSRTVRVGVRNAYTSRTMNSLLGPGDTDSKSWSLRTSGGWYDLRVTVESDPQFQYQLVGHLENGEDTVSEPAIGGLL